MRVIGVLDLLRGQAVHARGGVRDGYVAVRSVAGLEIAPGDPMAVARSYVERLGVSELYAADLDAIAGHPVQETAVSRVGTVGAPLWLDAGVRSVEQADRVRRLGTAMVVVGLETLRSYAALAEICDAVGGKNVAFSLDLRNGQPIVAENALAVGTPHEHAARAGACGVGAMIVLDLARVGMRSGIDLDMITDVRRAVPGLVLVAGGGVRDVEDLRRLAEAGCDAALVATALHDGRLTATDVAAAHLMLVNTA